MESKGTHIFIDFENINFTEDKTIEEHGKQIFNFMYNSIKEKSEMKIVHKHLEILEEPKTANGFTSVLLLDESHFTSHCYSDLGLLACDIFTCGKSDTEEISNYFINLMKREYPELKVNRYVINRRFLHKQKFPFPEAQLSVQM